MLLMGTNLLLFCPVFTRVLRGVTQARGYAKEENGISTRIKCIPYVHRGLSYLHFLYERRDRSNNAFVN
jgi:hypothetical protein